MGFFLPKFYLNEFAFKWDFYLKGLDALKWDFYLSNFYLNEFAFKLNFYLSKLYLKELVCIEMGFLMIILKGYLMI